MKDHDIIKAVAELDAWKEAFPRHPDLGKDKGGILLPYIYEQVGTGKRCQTLPDYPNSHDAIVPVIEKLYVQDKDNFRARFNLTLMEMLLLNKIQCRELFMPARQLCEALLRATGKWVEE